MYAEYTKEKPTMEIQLICYAYVPFKTPSYELWETFLDAYPLPETYRSYVQRIREISPPYPIGFGIKVPWGGTGPPSLELYFYQLDPGREHHLKMHPTPLFSSALLKEIDPILTVALWEEASDPLILSLDIDEAYLAGTKKQATYYFITGPVYFFTHKVTWEHEQETIQPHTSDYSVAYVYETILSSYPEWYKKAQFYQSNPTDLFLGVKDRDTCPRIGYYLQKISYNKFLHFLQEFQYAPAFLQSCTEIYDERYVFDVGFDIWKDGTLSKTMLYGVFARKPS